MLRLIMSHCFISYDHADSNLVGEIISKLGEAGIAVWKDSLSLARGRTGAQSGVRTLRLS